MAQEVLLTREGYEKLKKELEELKGPTRMRVAEAIREAKSHGDLKENAAYHEAKLNQTRLDSRVADLEKVLQSAKIVERPAGSSGAHIGSKVKLLDKEFGDEIVVTIVGSYEADPALDLISITSPLGGALIGRTAGDELTVEAPGGIQEYKVLELQ
ncbi:MAG: transcription elongation factor GreA [Fimbriimonadaceae bacterium]|jgi:transcription elongation factor GreA|nr:transcription elongation factor GreA [Fimbriimonadaceae bacterium]